MARLAEGAIGGLILCSLPVRRRTLTTTDWARNFRAPTRRGANATLVYHPDQSKTRRALQVVLEGWRWHLIGVYWRHYPPLLAGADKSTLLFPSDTPSGHQRHANLADACTTLAAN